MFVVACLQRLMVVEQNYGEMNARYQDVMAAKQRMESEVMVLQALSLIHI